MSAWWDRLENTFNNLNQGKDTASQLLERERIVIKVPLKGTADENEDHSQRELIIIQTGTAFNQQYCVCE